MGWAGGYVVTGHAIGSFFAQIWQIHGTANLFGDRFYSKSASTVAVLCLT